MDIRQLKYFLTIAEEEQITGAAKKLHIAQPPLSQQLMLLEKELNLKLVERGPRKIHLTEAGKILRNKAEQILELTESTIKELKDIEHGNRGTLSIGAVSSSGAALFPELIGSFSEKYPGINYEVWEGNTYRILEILNSGLIEVGIVRTPFKTDGLECFYLQSEPMIAAFSKTMDWDCNKTSIELEELLNKPIILYRRFEALINNAFAEKGLEPKILCKNDDARTTLLWASSAMGIGIVPKSALSLISNSNLSYKEILEPSLQTQIAAICIKDRYISAAARNFLELFST